MIIQNITTAYGHFNSGVAQTQTIVNKQVIREVGNVNTNYITYHPTSIKVSNTTGGPIHVAMFNEKEWDAYQLDYTLSDLYPIADNVTETFTGFNHDAITTIVISGVAIETYGTDLQINIIQD